MMGKISMKIKPKNLQIARWDYHATHINQLLTLATVEEEKKAAQILRWSFYHCFLIVLIVFSAI